MGRIAYASLCDCGLSAVGSAPPCQGGGRGFEPRSPLHVKKGPDTFRPSPYVARWPSGKAGACKAPIPGSNPGLASRNARALGSFPGALFCAPRLPGLAPALIPALASICHAPRPPPSSKFIHFSAACGCPTAETFSRRGKMYGFPMARGCRGRPAILGHTPSSRPHPSRGILCLRLTQKPTVECLVLTQT